MGANGNLASPPDLDLLLDAVKNGDAEELEKLLVLKSDTYDRSKWPKYPDDYKYKYSDLLEPEGEGGTVLQLACSVGKHENALKCVQLLCESIQVLVRESRDDTKDKLKEFIDYTRPGPGPCPWEQTPIHFAIENKATKVIAYLLDRKANVAAKCVRSTRVKEPTSALTLICQKVPDALLEVYDNAIQLAKGNNKKIDHKQIQLNLAVLTGVRKRKGTVGAREQQQNQMVNMVRETGSENYHKVPVDEDDDVELWRETEYLSYILEADNRGAKLLLHPLVKFFLEKKWEKVQRFFWIPFCLQILWLLVYSLAFVQLHVYTESLSNETTTEAGSTADKNEHAKDPNPSGTEAELKPPIVLWTVLFVIALLGAAKEIYIGGVLRKHYLTFEKLTQVLFILLFFIQFGLLMLGYMERVATLSVIGVALGTILLISHLGKITYFGQQVAAMKKVVSSFFPHMPLFFVWFLGFCLIFWALFYKSNESSVIVLLAIVAAMGTGEINAKDHLEESLKRSLEFHDLISVFCLMLFIITIVTLYFNLLIGYAVSDIKVLKEEAEAYEMSNRLSTIMTTESFLLSKIGRWIVRLFPCGSSNTEHYMDSIYVIPPSTFQTSSKLKLHFDDIPPEFMLDFKNIAYENVLKGKERSDRLVRQLKTMQQKGD